MRLKEALSVTATVLFFISSAIWFIEYRSTITANKLFGNMTYLSGSPYFSWEVSLIDGRYDWWQTSEDNVFVHYHLRYDGRYVHGDFNQDGLKDTAVIMTEMSGGTAELYIVAFLINDGKRLVHKISGYLGDRAIINSIREKNGKILVDMFVHQDGDCMAGPTHHVKSVFEYGIKENRIQEKRNSARSFLDPVILALKDRSLKYVLQRWDDLIPAGQTGDLSLHSI